MENQIISINLVPNLSTPAVVRVSQYDVGRPLVFKVYDGTSPADLTGLTAVIEGTKKSGLGFSESGTVSGNTVTLDTTLAMTQEDGSIPAEIRFTKTGEDVGTANFILAVEKSPHLEGTTDGTTETMADLQSQLDALDTRVEALEGGGGGLTEAVKSAMLQIARKVAYIDEHGQYYYDALEEALYPTPVPTWDYEWYATSQTVPTNMTGVSEYDFTTDPEAIYIRRSNAVLNFDYIGNCEIEIETKFNDYLGGSVMPQITLCMANAQTEGHYIGGVIAANKISNSPYINYNIEGNWVATTYDQRQYHVYNIKAKNGIISVTIDGTLVATGSGREYSSSIITGYNQPNYEPAFLKSIKFKRL